LKPYSHTAKHLRLLRSRPDLVHTAILNKDSNRDDSYRTILPQSFLKVKENLKFIHVNFITFSSLVMAELLRLS